MSTPKSEILEKLSSLTEGSVVLFPNDISRYRVVQNKVDDVVMFQHIDNSDKIFHLFYDEIDQINDNFIQLS